MRHRVNVEERRHVGGDAAARHVKGFERSTSGHSRRVIEQIPMPTIWHGVRGGLKDLGFATGGDATGGATPRTERDLSMKFVGIGVIVSTVDSRTLDLSSDISLSVASINWMLNVS